MRSLMSIICLAILFSFSAFSQTMEKVYESVDKVPEISKNGGNVQKYFAKKMQYPIDALAKEVEGKVLVSFVVSSKGVVKDINLEKGLTESTDQEALRLVQSMGKWKPGKIAGTAVATKVTVPVNFHLNEESKLLAEQLKPFYADDKPPLFVLDKKKVLGLAQIDYYNVKSIRVIKGEKAIALYGDEGKNGVLVIETKRGTSRDYQRY